MLANENAISLDIGRGRGTFSQKQTEDGRYQATLEDSVPPGSDPLQVLLLVGNLSLMESLNIEVFPVGPQPENINKTKSNFAPSPGPAGPRLRESRSTGDVMGKTFGFDFEISGRR